MTAETKECPFCFGSINAAARKCMHCGEWVVDNDARKSRPGDQVGGDKISAGDLSEVTGTAVGKESMAAVTGDIEGSFIQAQGDVTLSNDQRDEQYEIALNWEARGKPLMRGFDLSERDLSLVKLAGADLRNANLEEAYLVYADLRWIDMATANLAGAGLMSTDLTRSNLSRADLRRAMLVDAKLTKAVWPGCDLREADLRGVDMQEANLGWADLRGASLVNANLRGADLNGAFLEGAKYTTGTIWPEGFDPTAARAILVDIDENPVEEQED